jgi:acyl transferase domain-containing protein
MGALAPVTSAIKLGVTVTDPTGIAVTAMVAAAFLPSLVAVIVAVPTDIAVTIPLADTVATLGLSLAQLMARSASTFSAASLATALSCCVDPSTRLNEETSRRTDETGTGRTVNVALPVTPSLVAMMFVVPGDKALTTPLLDTVATASSSELHTTPRPSALRPASKVEAVA